MPQPQSFAQQLFAPQSFDPQGPEPEPVAAETAVEVTFDRVPYPPPYGSPAPRTPTVQPNMPGVQPQAPWEMPTSRTYTAPSLTPAPWAPASGARNWLGITSIVLALLGGGLIGGILGWKGMEAAREGRATNGRMAKWGLILNVAVPLLIVIVAFGVIAMGSVGGTDRSPWSSVAVGQCLAPSDATSGGAGIFAPERTACRDEHWSQVYYVGTIVGGSQSRDAAVMQQVKGMCTSREALARLDSARIADLYPTIIEPDDDSWAANERWVECLASDADGSITGSWLNGS